jgi:hypothetical protein
VSAGPCPCRGWCKKQQGALIERYSQVKTEVLGEEPVPVSLCPPQIPTEGKPTTWRKTCPNATLSTNTNPILTASSSSTGLRYNLPVHNRQILIRLLQWKSKRCFGNLKKKAELTLRIYIYTWDKKKLLYVCATQKRVHEICNLQHNWKVSVADFFSLTRNLMLTRCSLLQSDILRPRVKTRLYLKMRQLVLSEAIELKLVTLWQDRSCSIAVYLFHPPTLGSRAIGLVSCFLCQTSYTAKTVN